mgnify:CR=1 FL=1
MEIWLNGRLIASPERGAFLCPPKSVTYRFGLSIIMRSGPTWQVAAKRCLPLEVRRWDTAKIRRVGRSWISVGLAGLETAPAGST